MRLDFLKSDRFWKWVLFVGVGIFLLSRILTLTSFPIFNDEAIYLQYSQIIHEDFGKYKLISAGLNVYQDWKPPFQYWFGSVFFGLVEDPLLAGRLASFVISLFGLLGIYLFVKELFGKREASLAVLLYALCPPALFMNGQFIAETFVFSLAPWMYWCVLKAIRPEKIRLQYAVGAAVFGALVLLSKQSGMVYVLLSILWPILLLKDRARNDQGVRSSHDWRSFLIRLAVVAASITVALILRRLGISSESAQIERQFNDRWLMTLPEALSFPIDIWRTNWVSIRDYYYHYYSVFILLPILYFFFTTLRKLDPRKVVVGLGFLGGSTAVLFLLRGFNEYIYNTAVIVFLIPLVAASFREALEATAVPRVAGASRDILRVIAGLTLASFAALLVHWAYQGVLMKVSPAGYIMRGTPWAIAGYVENWSGGWGVAEAVSYVKGQDAPALVLADPQWGNPRTTLEVYNRRSRKVVVVGLTGDFQRPSSTISAKEHIRGLPFKTRMAVFSAATNEVRALWQDNVEKYLCDTREEIQVLPNQPPIVVCKF